MPTQDTSGIKEKIVWFFKKSGPSLPVHVAREIGLSILFTSAFLSELLSEKKIRISNMRVGSSPVYFIPGQEPALERFSQHLKSREKDAFNILKENRFLSDSKQEPAIRVALRAIRDFAIPFKKDDEIFWRYFTISEGEFPETRKKEEKVKAQLLVKEEPKREQLIIKEKQKSLGLDIFDKNKEKKSKEKPIEKKATKVKVSHKKNEKFFNKIKEFLSRKSIEIIDLVGFSKEDLTLIVRTNEKEELLMAYNKKRISEADIIKTHKKASELKIPYRILSLGETPKKLNEFLEAIKDLSEIQKIE